ncbi:MAG: lysophospholipase, partial [Clostridia bacterium]|nr:lysophospholipase [Clostridia bacterium]
MRILFQGDSITDCGRNYSNDDGFGAGYPLYVRAELGFCEPGCHEFINRGISGNRIVDLYARMKRDIINLRPDVMSILIGVNDVWHEINDQNGVDAEKFYKIYSMLISEIKAELPELKIMILEPFAVKGPATTEAWDTFSVEVAKRAEVARRIAEEFSLTFVPLQAGFDELSK